MKINHLKERLLTALTTTAAFLVAGITIGMAISLCMIVVKITARLWGIL